MYELSLQQQEEINGGGALTTAMLCILLGTGIYKLLVSSKGKISIPRFLHLEWRN